MASFYKTIWQNSQLTAFKEADMVMTLQTLQSLQRASFPLFT